MSALDGWISSLVGYRRVGAAFEWKQRKHIWVKLWLWHRAVNLFWYLA